MTYQLKIKIYLCGRIYWKGGEVSHPKGSKRGRWRWYTLSQNKQFQNIYTYEYVYYITSPCSPSLPVFGVTQIILYTRRHNVGEICNTKTVESYPPLGGLWMCPDIPLLKYKLCSQFWKQRISNSVTNLSEILL